MDASPGVGQETNSQRDNVLDAELESAVLEPVAQIAQVRVVVPMTDVEQRLLLDYLERVTGRTVELQIRLDGSILGGVWVRMDDLVMDGSVRARLDALHEHLCANCRIPKGAGPAEYRNQL